MQNQYVKTCLSQVDINNKLKFLEVDKIFIVSRTEKHLQNSKFSDTYRRKIKCTIISFYVDLLQQMEI